MSSLNNKLTKLGIPLTFEDKKAINKLQRKKSRTAQRLSKVQKLDKHLAKLQKDKIIRTAIAKLLDPLTANRYLVLEEGAEKLDLAIADFAKLLIANAQAHDRLILYKYLKQFIG